LLAAFLLGSDPGKPGVLSGLEITFAIPRIPLGGANPRGGIPRGPWSVVTDLLVRFGAIGVV